MSDLREQLEEQGMVNAMLESDLLAAKEEISKLNSWLKNAEAKEAHYDELRRMFNDMEAKAITAEKEVARLIAWHNRETKLIIDEKNELQKRVERDREKIAHMLDVHIVMTQFFNLISKGAHETAYSMIEKELDILKERMMKNEQN